LRLRSFLVNPTVGHISFWLAVLVLTANGVRISRVKLKAALLPTRIILHTVILQDYTFQDGLRVPAGRFVYAVRSDGSRVIEATGSQRILDFASGKRQTVIENRRLKTTTFDPDMAKGMPWLPDPNKNCNIPGPDSQHVAGTEMVDGYRTIRVNNGPTTQWLSLDYGCALIRDRADWGNGQGSEKILIALIAGEPSPVLFEDPAGYEEVPPSQRAPGIPGIETSDAYCYTHRPQD
jgi:hypothetical protein